ncbi:MAG: hypothetical protein E7509_06235 [Ruminococcus sp.]|nr:hypothetical protein [Ruminococcus sp.]
MKLMTLNTHSLVEENYEEKLKEFVKGVIAEKPDIIALQEINQSVCGDVVKGKIEGYFPSCKGIKIKSDNHLLTVFKMLKKEGLFYHFTMTPMKKSYGKYEECVGIMSLSHIEEISLATVSDIDSYDNWKTRKIIGIRVRNFSDKWFYSVHFGWWTDNEEPFSKQWERVISHIKNQGEVWLMGDTNAPELSGESYEEIQKSGFHDSYTLAEKKDEGYTVAKVIDGWKDKISDTDGMRIDQIWCSKKTPVKSSRVVFNGKYYNEVSDHSGVVVEV